jgi:hypothetical protein
MLSEHDEPGLDRHVWESEYATLEPQLEDDPEEALPELAELVERMLEARGLAPDDEVVFENTEEIASFRAAKQTADRTKNGEDLDPGDVAFAIRELRQFYDSLLEAPRLL